MKSFIGTRTEFSWQFSVPGEEIADYGSGAFVLSNISLNTA